MEDFIMEDEGYQARALVIDNGAHLLRFGLSGSDSPDDTYIPVIPKTKSGED